MILETIKHAIMITAFVMAMMLIIEFINVQSKGKWLSPLKEKGWLQILFAAFLGATPGCLGTYTAVSLYSHRVFSFAALVTALIATSGDEAFIMLSTMPNTALKLFLIIFLISILVGGILYFFMKNKNFMKHTEDHLEIHEEKIDCISSDKTTIIQNFKHISFQRAIILVGISLFLIGLLSGELGHVHGILPTEAAETEVSDLISIDQSHAGHDHSHDGHDHSNSELSDSDEHSGFHWDWISGTYLIVSLIVIIIISIVNDHFLEEHLWGHIIKKHFVKIFLWTLAALLAIHFLDAYINMEEWVKANLITILIVAVLIGIIPQSGPHFIFILLFMQGVIPFSILMANSIVQDGHGAIPLLAESKKSFILAKGVNVIIGLIVGLLGLYFGF